MDLFVLCLFMLVLVNHGALGLNEREEARCRKHGPVIRFPFRLKGRQPDHCGYPGFDLSCTDKKETLLELPNSVKLHIEKIDYISQLIAATDPDHCLPRQLQNLNLSSSPFQFAYTYLYDFSIFSCKSAIISDYYLKLPCLISPANNFYAFFNFAPLGLIELMSCTKMYNISSFPDEILRGNSSLYLNWTSPACGFCEAQGKYCKFF